MIQEWDLSILEWITHSLHAPWLVALFYAITLLGNGGLLWLIFAGYFRFNKKNARAAWMILTALILTSILTDGIIKNLVCRPRPFVSDPAIIPMMIRPSSYSFPSGHASTSFASAMMIYRIQPKLGRWALAAAAFIGFSRLILCVHYPSDVLVGGIMGSGLAWWLYSFLEKRRMNHDKNSVV